MIQGWEGVANTTENKVMQKEPISLGQGGRRKDGGWSCTWGERIPKVRNQREMSRKHSMKKKKQLKNPQAKEMHVCQLRYIKFKQQQYCFAGMQALDKDLCNLIFMDEETEAPYGLSKGLIIVQHWPHLG